MDDSGIAAIRIVRMKSYGPGPLQDGKEPIYIECDIELVFRDGTKVVVEQLDIDEVESIFKGWLKETESK